MMMKSKIGLITAFFKKEIRRDVNPKDRLYQDLGFSGIDLSDVLSRFSKEFNVDLSNIDFSDYMLDEIGLRYYYYKWFKPEKLKRKPITIEHLARVVEKGSWFYPNLQQIIQKERGVPPQEPAD
jgi:acyl carrier protein